MKTCRVIARVSLLIGCASCDFPAGHTPIVHDATDERTETGVLNDERGLCVNFHPLEQFIGPPANVLVLFQLLKCDGSPVPKKSIDDFLIEEDGEPISRFESEADIFNPEQALEIQTVLLLDVSGSIVDAPEGLAPLRAAVDEFLASISDTKVHIFVFDGSPRLRRMGYGGEPEDVREYVDQIDETLSLDPSTNLNGAIVDGLNRLDELRENFLRPRRTFAGNLVVFTDGTDRAGRVSGSTAISRVRQSSHSVFTIGLGAEIDLDFLFEIGRARFRTADDIEGLGLAFREIALDVTRRSQSYYAVGYCSPRRAGRDQLRLSLETASLGDPLIAYFDATNFSAGCSIETLQYELYDL